MTTILLIGGDLAQRTAALLAPKGWHCIGLRRREMPPTAGDPITWRQADLANKETLAFLSSHEFSTITHILYAPAPGGRTPAHYEDVYGEGIHRLLSSLSPACREQLQRCVLVGSSAVWAPAEDWVNEDSPTVAAGFRSQAILNAEAALHRDLPKGVGVALRLSGLYGPGRLRVIDGLRAGTITAPDGPGHWANRIHIDDAARACVHLLTLANPEPVYIGTDDHPMPTVELYEGLARLAGGPPPARERKPPSGKRLSNARLRASGWEPEWPNALYGYSAYLNNTDA